MRTEFLLDHDPDGSQTVTNMYEACIDRVVDIELRGANTGFPTKDVYVLRVDEDGDVVVCEPDDQGMPQQHSTFAIPQSAIYRVRIFLGNLA